MNLMRRAVALTIMVLPVTAVEMKIDRVAVAGAP